ncbi:MAG: hypothetical protein L6Q54_15340 [Leptospiraceae bacterium]|nr:hypothetical protein [Leptospiraceae bacterium]MCK6382608.1 hypothetical protein [Leptospiraceae bacterium]
MKDRFFIYYSGTDKLISPKTVNSINYDGYLHNSEKKRLSFLFSNDVEKGNFTRDFQLGNKNLKIVRTEIQKNSTSSSTVTPTVDPQPQTNSLITINTTPKTTTTPTQKQETGSNSIFLIGGLAGLAFLFLNKKGKKRRR